MSSLLKNLKLIGRGAFSRVYRDVENDSNEVLIISNDKAKEAFSMGWIDDPAGLFPVLTCIDQDDDGKALYSCKFYPRTRGLKNHLDSDQWALYKTLRDAFQTLPNAGYENVYSMFSGLESSLSENQYDSLMSALSVMADYGNDVSFEISPRNVAVDNGKLVLLDVFFFLSDLK